ncbi:MAG: SUF system NifU family Fe-S cluster assembly protein [Elusimicrobia bacterium RIFOXYD12_FULL_66_9]|nr:MAG: SUF system NifU family Fe-S cluster assembly protein [Elusimicrobia bacterium RIFOXYD12_FULL_66_9]
MEGDSELQDLYREVLMDYYGSSTRKGTLDPADLRAHGINPVCGDELEITARREGGHIAKLRYTGHGCVISQASAAMMAEALEGASVERARELIKAFKAMMLENAPVASLPEELEQLSALEGVRRFPLRVKCATLGWNTILQGLERPSGEEPR